MTEFTEIPVLDVAPLIAGEDTTDLAQAFARAYGETGFAYIIGHGIDPALRAAVFDASRRALRDRRWLTDSNPRRARASIHARQ